MASKREMVSIILKYDLWDDDGTGEIVRFHAAPIVGVDDEGQPMRVAETLVSRDTAAALVKAGKASVPLK